MSGDQNPAAATVTDGPSAVASGPAVEPPEASTPAGLVLVPPSAVLVVAHEQATRALPVSPEVAGRLQTTVEAYVADLLATDVHAPSFNQNWRSCRPRSRTSTRPWTASTPSSSARC